MWNLNTRNQGVRNPIITDTSRAGMDLWQLHESFNEACR